MPTLSRNALIAVTVAFAAPAGADEPAEPSFEYTAAYEFARPASLEPDHDLAMQMSETLLQEQHFGGLPAIVVADANVGEQWAFYIFDISSGARAAEPERIIRDSFQQLRTGSGEVLEWNESVEADMATATMEWRFDRTQTLTIMRSHMWVTSSGGPHQLRAECIVAEAKAAALRAKCDEAFAALTIVAPDRGRLGPLPTATKPAAQPADDNGGDGASTGASLRPPTEGAVVYETKPSKTPEKDNTFLYVGGAILLVIAVYMAMRRGSGDDEPQEPADE